MMAAALATSECNSIKLIKVFESGVWLGGGGGGGGGGVGGGGGGREWCGRLGQQSRRGSKMNILYQK